MTNAEQWPIVISWKIMPLLRPVKWFSHCVDLKQLSKLIPVIPHLFALAALPHVNLLVMPLALVQIVRKLTHQVYCSSNFYLCLVVIPWSIVSVILSNLFLVLVEMDAINVNSGTTSRLSKLLNFEQLYLLLLLKNVNRFLLYWETNEKTNFIMRF